MTARDGRPRAACAGGVCGARGPRDRTERRPRGRRNARSCGFAQLVHAHSGSSCAHVRAVRADPDSKRPGRRAGTASKQGFAPIQGRANPCFDANPRLGDRSGWGRAGSGGQAAARRTKRDVARVRATRARAHPLELRKRARRARPERSATARPSRDCTRQARPRRVPDPARSPAPTRESARAPRRGLPP